MKAEEAKKIAAEVRAKKLLEEQQERARRQEERNQQLVAAKTKYLPQIISSIEAKIKESATLGDSKIKHEVNGPFFAELTDDLVAHFRSVGFTVGYDGNDYYNHNSGDSGPATQYELTITW